MEVENLIDELKKSLLKDGWKFSYNIYYDHLIWLEKNDIKIRMTNPIKVSNHKCDEKVVHIDRLL